MEIIINKVLPVIIIFVIGAILGKTRVLKKEYAVIFLKVVFYIALPGLIILSVSKINLTPELALLPVISLVIIGTTFLVAWLTGKYLKYEKPVFGVTLMGSMILNTSFILPFFIAAYGEGEVGRLLVFDLPNIILVFSLVYFLACRFGNTQCDSSMMFKKIAGSPPLWALLIGFILNIFHIRLPDFISSLMLSVGNMTIPLTMLALGVFFNLKPTGTAYIVRVILTRMILSLILAFALCHIFSLDGMNRIVVMIGATTPAGYNTLTFASLENLDRELAAGVVSFTMLIGLFLTPLLIYFLSAL
jgi:malate permease and related proteins